MLKQVTVSIIIDDHKPEKCSKDCQYYGGSYCILCDVHLDNNTTRCKQCLEGAK